VVVFAVFGVLAVVLCAVGQVRAHREETARLQREYEALREKYAPLASRTEYR
jgi:hypothetical protein